MAFYGNNEQEDDFEDSDYENVTRSELTRSMSIVRLKIPNTNCKMEVIPTWLDNVCYTPDRDIKVENDNSTEYHIRTYAITAKSSVVPGTQDINHGKISFYYRVSGERVKVYAVLQSGRSNAWVKLQGLRDIQFPKQFAMFFLDPNSITKTSGFYLTGSNSGRFTNSYQKTDSFDSENIMHNYGVIETLSAQITDNEDGKILKEFLLQNNFAVKMLMGQINVMMDLKATDVKSLCNFLNFVDDKLSTFKVENISQKWKFLTYIHKIDGLLKSKLEKDLLEKMNAVYKDRKTTTDAFEMESFLVHQHQHEFDRCKQVTLWNGKKQLSWSSDSGDLHHLGETIRVKDVFNALYKNKPLESVNDIKLSFYNLVTDEEEKIHFHNFLVTQATISSTNEEVKSYFHYGTHWFMVKLDTLMQTTKRFVNVVRSCIMKKEEGGSYPEILPWCTGESKQNFSLKQLVTFVKCKEGSSEEGTSESDLDQLEKILTKRRSLFTKHGIMGDWENNCAVETVSFEDDKHNVDLLAMNMLVLQKTELGKCIAPKGKPSYKVIGELQNIFSKSKTLKEMESNYMKKAKVPTKKDWSIVEKELLKKKQCLEKLDNGNFRVHSPYITKDMIEEIKSKKLPVCPVRLVQFLRMYIPKDEGEYNELYHLSNCKCQKSSWKYVVGDRILDKNNQWIELFDVMALSTKRKEAYFFHVKNGFGAEQSRAVCSQVRVCGNEIWESITANFINNSFKKYFSVATKVEEENDLHKSLTKKEIKSISKDGEQFSSFMCDDEMKFFICLSPLFQKPEYLKSAVTCNFDFKFKDSHFSEIAGGLNKLIGAGVIHQKTKVVTSTFFATKNKFYELLRKQSCKNKEADDMHKTIKNLTGMSGIMDGSSFVAKVSLIDVHRIFSDFFVANGQTKVHLKIWEINGIPEHNVSTDNTKENYPKKQTTISTFMKKSESRKRKRNKSTIACGQSSKKHLSSVELSSSNDEL
ncbi:uncharacterized protein LOC130636570 isoform X2 [Hydractinia symbiolongicarpus]|uniref:uncharacterized protein LOC130636570 isoform X2 n=1 Tax=Hydractinia symbiolongicarpus TaxID=13093 RepID=UPI00254AFF12|nr:uncharacterized protein LOC130636570 isoform X2 [Hydractinia symbiolongicarpus]